jgi:hypothetical protein
MEDTTWLLSFCGRLGWLIDFKSRAFELASPTKESFRAQF